MKKVYKIKRHKKPKKLIAPNYKFLFFCTNTRIC